MKLKDINFSKIRREMIDKLNKLEKISFVSLNDKIKDKIFTQYPFERNGAFLFFKAIKYNNIHFANEMLKLCPYLVFDFD